MSSVPTSVYRYYDEHGILLYVGVTGRGMLRNTEHNKTKDWWPFVARQEVDHFDNRDDALQRESKVIVQHRPPFNVQQNYGHERTRAAYLALREASARPFQVSTNNRRLEFYPHTRGEDGLGTVLRSAPVYPCVVTVDPTAQVLGYRRFGKMRAAMHGPFILLTIAGKTEPVVSAAAKVKLVQKPPGIRIANLVLEVERWLPAEYRNPE